MIFLWGWNFEKLKELNPNSYKYVEEHKTIRIWVLCSEAMITGKSGMKKCTILKFFDNFQLLGWELSRNLSILHLGLFNNHLTPSLPWVDKFGHFCPLFPMSTWTLWTFVNPPSPLSCPRGYWMTPLAHLMSKHPVHTDTVVEKTNGTGRDLCSKWPILTKL